jgi:hypothetical protein
VVNWASKLAIAFVALSGIAPTYAVGASVGMITKVENQAQVSGGAAAVGTIVNTNDTLSTGAKSRLQVTFRDKTELTLGENATVVIDRFVFDPDASVGEATLNASQGALRLVTGKISHMQNKDIKVNTPLAALAVRGTDFWSGVTQGQYGVLLVHNSRLQVRGAECTEGSEEDRERCRCAVTLDQAGEGTDIDRNNRCPGKPYQWPAEKVNAALSQTGFSIAMGPAQALPAAVGVAGVAGAFAVTTSTDNNEPPPITPAQPASP